MSAPVGYGKTADLQYYYRKKSVLWLNQEGGLLIERPTLHTIKQPIVVIDDITWITDESSQR